MDHLTTDPPRSARVREVMARYGVDEDEAIFMLDLAEGKSRGDLGGPDGLTDEQRVALGLDPWPIPSRHPSPAKP
ncbi:MAG TPA: hypothetical protein VH482_37145 [Thermomicrobiales bacterium]|jgi:hypothetical protein